MQCSLCLEKLIWGGDHTYDECGYNGVGVVGNYTCQNKECDVEGIYIYTKTE